MLLAELGEIHEDSAACTTLLRAVSKLDKRVTAQKALSSVCASSHEIS
jgi:hypothetical protein